MGLDLDPPVGDAGEMRAKAARLGLECEGLVRRALDLDRAMEEMDYRCPAADRFRAEIRRERAYLDGIVGEVGGVRARLLREANRVEAAQKLFVRLAGDARVAGNAVDAGLRDAYNELRNLAVGDG